MRRRPVHLNVLLFVAVAGQVTMLLLATVIIGQFRAAQMVGAGDIGSAYMQGFLTPYAEAAHATGELSPQMQAELRALVGPIAAKRRFDAIRIRAKDGSVMFASDSAADALAESPEEFLQAASGLTIAEIHPPKGDVDLGFYPMVEIYAPIYDKTTAQLIAVGEIYQDARSILAERTTFERTVWGAVILAIVGFLAIMFVVARQHRQLVLQFEQQRAIAAQNQQLHAEANAAWQSSGQTHEALLNHLGAELHDGPIQMLSLLALMKEPGPVNGGAAGPSAQSVARDVLTDLRRISAGLILPDLGRLSVRGTMILAITRHTNATGTEVALDFGPLPDSIDDPRKTCIYRIVQEGLNNAYHHGGGVDQRVRAHVNDGALNIAVLDGGSPSEKAEGVTRDLGLGVDGLRNRLKVFSGSLEARPVDGGGFVLSARLPLQ
jgi:signal transduction histidine kinase